MTMRIPRRALGAAALLLPGLARAQGLLARPVTIVIPYSPGTPPDVVARLLAEGMQQAWSQPVVPENRPGASGNIGTAAVARAAPDGHTLVVTAGTMAMNVSLFRTLSYDPLTSFAPIALLASVPFALIAHPTAGATMAEFLSLARASPGRIHYGSPGVGTPHHIGMELFRQRAGIDVVHVPYRSAAGAVSDILGGQIGVMLIPISQAVELSRAGRVRILAVATEQRLPQVPDAPTMAEAGVPNMLMTDWYGVYAPAGTPPDTLRRLNETVNQVLASPATLQALAAQGMTPLGGTPERLRDHLASQITRWATVIRDANITAD